MSDGLTTLHGDNSKDFIVYRKGSGNTVEIFDIHVGTARRKGTGTALVKEVMRLELIKGTRTIWAITRVTNLIAQEFYESMGFYICAILRNFYRDEGGIDANAIMFGKEIR